jgi:hypothetical protein
VGGLILGGQNRHILAPNQIYFSLKHPQTPNKQAFEVVQFVFFCLLAIMGPREVKIPPLYPPNHLGTLNTINWLQSTQYSLSFAPKMTKKFNKLQVFLPFNVWVNTANIYEKYGPTAFFDHILSKQALHDV